MNSPKNAKKIFLNILQGVSLGKCDEIGVKMKEKSLFFIIMKMLMLKQLFLLNSCKYKSHKLKVKVREIYENHEK